MGLLALWLKPAKKLLTAGEASVGGGGVVEPWRAGSRTSAKDSVARETRPPTPVFTEEKPRSPKLASWCGPPSS